MKKYLFIILVLTACKQETPSFKRDLIMCDLAPIDNAKGKPAVPPGRNKPKPPADTTTTPTPTPTPPKDTTTYPTDGSEAACLYFDFDGDTNTDESWMMSNSGSPITVAASALTADQKVQAMNVTKYAYRQFRVLVTDDEAVYNAFQFAKTKIVVTSTRQWTYKNTTGLAYPFSITAPNSTCYVFEAPLATRAEWVGKIGTHESGHTFGLHHQKQYSQTGELLNGYRYGCNMGQCFYEQGYWIYGIWWWGQGEQPIYQDDNAIIAGVAGYR